MQDNRREKMLERTTVMVRKLAFAFVLTMSLLVAREASAVPVLPFNWDVVKFDTTFPDGIVDTLFDNLDDPGDSGIEGTIANNVYQLLEINGDGNTYFYTHTVTPGFNDVNEFNTQFPVGGFIAAGYSFGNACTAAGFAPSCADPEDLFSISRDPDLTIDWTANFDWDSSEPVEFVIASLKPPSSQLGTYRLKNASIHADGESYRPTPEPGTMLLLGSGLAAVYGARRRRNQKVQ
jgi:hypothetical protein